MPTTNEPQKTQTKANTAAQPAAPTVTPDSEKTSGVAVAALILAFFFPLIGLILGIVALSSIKKSGEKGKGLAKAAIIISIILMLLGVAIAGFVVYSAQKAVKDAGLNVSKGTISATNKDGESVSIGNDVKLPNGFPSDVPIYEPSDTKAAVTTAKDSFAITLLTSDSADKVKSFYDSKLASEGWTANDNNSQYDFSSGRIASYTKDTRTLGVLIASDESTGSNKTSVTLTVGPTNSSTD